MLSISYWFGKTLSQRDRKKLVCLLFGLRSSLERHADYDLFLQFIRVLDTQYHSLKAEQDG